MGDTDQTIKSFLKLWNGLPVYSAEICYGIKRIVSDKEDCF